MPISTPSDITASQMVIGTICSMALAYSVLEKAAKYIEIYKIGLVTKDDRPSYLKLYFLVTVLHGHTITCMFAIILLFRVFWKKLKWSNVLFVEGEIFSGLDSNVACCNIVNSWVNIIYFDTINAFAPKSDQCQISPAASQEILHHAVWRSWLFIANSDVRWLYYQFSLLHLYISL